jgi:hypothetical protein
MFNSLLVISTKYRNENLFPKSSITGTFSVLLKNMIVELEQENKGYRFDVVENKKDKWINDIIIYSPDKKVKRISFGDISIYNLKKKIGKILK